MNEKPTLVVIVITVLHDFVDIVPRRDGRGNGVRVENGDVFVASPGEVQGRRTAPGPGADDEEGGVVSQV